MEYRLIDVKSIKSNTQRSGFSEKELAELADSILECEGLLNPIVMKMVSLDRYEVVDGHKEYWAAVVAQEKSPRKGEMINAIVFSAKEESKIRKQLSNTAIPKSGDEKKLKGKIVNIIHELLGDILSEKLLKKVVDAVLSA